MVRAVADCIKVAAVVVGTLILSACSSNSHYSPVDERSIGGRQPVKIVTSQSRPDQYRVRRGDTLYSIAFRYGLDFRQLARTNGISDRYEIYPGQTLKLKATPSTRSVASSVPAKPSSKKVVSAQKPVAPQKKAKLATEARPVVVRQAAADSKKTVPAPVVRKKVASSSRALSWRWPASGKIIQGYSSRGKVNKGINFAGTKGDPVRAAEAGKVVYAGSGLLGYGKLVIINHNQKYLSAYAHNSRIHVKENDMVKIGDKIAEIGSSGAARTMLHFEIRKDGQPVDPMKYLPRKR
ncbi:peptidoglycan DD-metalloendopeptidase family protein [Amphritea japonica]|uniref:Lipoprotein NlpD n=1 Tax=Amphritea japonica ATCC BAA-1530 TaxID=1278309 RepID=A0A7R6SRE2_9GAMM|nr:peptidoglycan DD-metalloendopeptidase family protein [Amphritea japonica]BBB25096.1 lipoprotein NlpD [Amphritea japonica ATCC BAA-1530]